MICSNCAAVCEEDLRYCDICGADLTRPTAEEAGEIPVISVIETPYISQAKPEAIPVPTVPAPKKGRLWPPLVILAVMICLGTMLFFLLPSTPPDTDPQIAEPWFSIKNGTVSFHPEYYSGSEELVIPETINGQTVTAIADYAFSGNDTITTVILPNTLTHIGDYAFSSCKGLRGIYVPGSVTGIGVYAFADCEQLEAVYIPGTVQSIGHGALDSCDSLRFILFDGTYSQWTSLYRGYFVSTVELHAIDGVYYTRP